MDLMNGHCLTAAPRGDTFGGFDLGELIDEVPDPMIRRSPFAQELLSLYLGSFVSSQGRQYSQLCDFYVLVALIEERVRAGRVSIDWELVLTPAYVAERALARMPLPGVHTQAPEHVPGQVQGVYRFWWYALCDVFQHRYFGVRLPSSSALNTRMRACGVPLYATSSSSWEELAAIHTAFGAYRDDPAVERATPAELAWRCLHPHLAAEVHWQTLPRPRRRGNRDQAAPDRHESMLRTLIADAVTTPASEHSIYDECILLVRDALTSLLDDPRSDPDLVELHQQVVDAYNHNHPDAPITALHR